MCCVYSIPSKHFAYMCTAQSPCKNLYRIHASNVWQGKVTFMYTRLEKNILSNTEFRVKSYKNSLGSEQVTKSPH